MLDEMCCLIRFYGIFWFKDTSIYILEAGLEVGFLCYFVPLLFGSFWSVLKPFKAKACLEHSILI
jgi:hypothetical protein